MPSDKLTRQFDAALRAAGGAAPMQLAWRLGFVGAAARLTGRPDPRPLAEIAYARLLAAERTETARRLSADLRKAGVRHCLIKAAALEAFYAPGERDADDLDLLLAHEDYAVAEGVLAAAGYRPQPGADAEAPPSMRRGLGLVGSSDLAPPLDLQWGLAPVHRLLSDSDEAMLDPLWDVVAVQEGVSIPPPAWHMALLMHHMVYHDFLHARGAVDLLLLGETLTAGDTSLTRRIARTLQVGRAMDAWLGGRLTLQSMLALSDRASAEQHRRITLRRLVRRARFLDHRWDMWRLVRDAVAPPDAYLRWRWPTAATPLGRWRCHARRTMAKLIFPS